MRNNCFGNPENCQNDYYFCCHNTSFDLGFQSSARPYAPIIKRKFLPMNSLSHSDHFRPHRYPSSGFSARRPSMAGRFSRVTSLKICTKPMRRRTTLATYPIQSRMVARLSQLLKDIKVLSSGGHQFEAIDDLLDAGSQLIPRLLRLPVNITHFFNGINYRSINFQILWKILSLVFPIGLHYYGV